MKPSIFSATQRGISMPSRARIGGVAQEVPSSSTSLLDTVLAADTERASLLAEAEVATDPHRIAEIQIRLADIDAHSAEARAAILLTGLGFTEEQQQELDDVFVRARKALAIIETEAVGDGLQGLARASSARASP